MSKLFSVDEPPEPAPSRYSLRGPVLRKNRSGGSLHPEEVNKRLAAKSVAEMPKTGWHWPFGWLLILWCPDGTRRYIDIPASATYADAVKERDYELAQDDYDGATLIRKTYKKA